MPIRQQLVDSFREKRGQFDFWLQLLLFAFLGMTLWPVTMWIALSAHDQSRILNALIVLVLASVVLVKYGRIEVRHPFNLNPSARKTLIAAYALLTLSFTIQRFLQPAQGTLSPSLLLFCSAIIFSAYCCALSSFTLYVFGQGARRITYTVASTFYVFLLLSIFMKPLDWPLRTLAGKYSGTILGWIGKTVELGILNGPSEPPKLILRVNEHPFHVASECNGFGVILTSLLLAVLLAIYRRLNPLRTLLNVTVGITLGFAFNILRIVVIVLLAPALMNHYMLMHEVVGTITYWSCLILVWTLLNGPGWKDSRG